MEVFFSFFRIIIAPFVWAFDQFCSESLSFGSVPVYTILIALIIMGILFVNLFPFVDARAKAFYEDQKFDDNQHFSTKWS